MLGAGNVLRTAGRRWYILLAGLIATAGLLTLVPRYVPVTYDLTASVLLLPPANAVAPTGETKPVLNPFLDLGGLDIAAGVLANSLTDTRTVDQIAPEGSGIEYTVEEDASVSGSVLEFAVNARTEAEARAALAQLLELGEARLLQLQDEVAAAPAFQLRLMTVTDNTVAEPNFGNMVRAMIVVGAAGIVLTLLFAVSFDALRRRRKAKVAQRAAAAVADDAAPPADAEPAFPDESSDDDETPPSTEPIEAPETSEPAEEPETSEPAEEPETTEPAEEPETPEPDAEPDTEEPPEGPTEEPEPAEPTEEPEPAEPTEEPEPEPEPEAPRVPAPTASADADPPDESSAEEDDAVQDDAAEPASTRGR
ncbi:hypothetical protein ACFVAJ_10845 [Agromyces sp. NPDC057679]|uniref:hypothetical protein n=1 Tax=Agromyces sp. NPDC057679 TaxID=3346207 RepID=UPI00366D55F0